MATTNDLIKRASSRVVRRAFIKRRLNTTGLFESTWQEITNDIKSWGTVSARLDVTRFNRFRFSGTRLKVINENGKYNPEDLEVSFWYNFASPQRSLVRIEVGYIDQSVSGGIYTNTEYPQDGGSLASAFIGVIAGDMYTSDKNEVELPIAPLTEVFRQYPAAALSGYTTTGMTASKFLENVRDHQDGSGNYVFRPFFNNTSTGFNIQTTTAGYVGLDTSTSGRIVDSSVWDVIETLAEAEQKVPYVGRDGVFNFVDRPTASTTSAYDFYGPGFNNRQYGVQIKSLDKYGFAYSKYYSRVRVKFNEAATASSYVTVETSLTVSFDSLPWQYGHKTIDVNNILIQNTTVAQSIATAIFNQASNLKREIAFSANLIPQLEIFDQITVSYQSDYVDPASLWDNYNWAEAEGAPEIDFPLIWSAADQSAIAINNDEYRLLSIEHNLERLETKITARKT